ncbi:ferritin-like-domain-containing protein [Russula dissimulans]|nr:ferritin-like-domain-containing protein [Russula dissimulans]
MAPLASAESPSLVTMASPQEKNNAVDVSAIHTVRIFPRIGIARVGNSTSPGGWYYGPEVPGRFDAPASFKDGHGAVLRQAARFRVYAFDANDKVLGELNQASGFELNWEVDVANRKSAWYAFMGRAQAGAFQPGYRTLRNPKVQPDLPPEKRDKLIISSGLKSVKGPHADPIDLRGKFYGSKDVPTDVYLGEISTDDWGRLVFLAGSGCSPSIAHEDQPYPWLYTDFDNPDWIDDTCDGTVNVKVEHNASQRVFTPPEVARVIGAAPKYAFGIYAPTSLYDLIEDVYEGEKRKALGDKYNVGDVKFHEHIWALLQRPPLISWVNENADRGHGPNANGNFFDPQWQEWLSDPSKKREAIRKDVLGRIRLPTTNGKYDLARAGQAFPYFMPWLSGDNGRATAGDQSTFASITELQYDRLVKWSEGNFIVEPPPPPLPQHIEELPLQKQPDALTKAHLESTIGAPLFPGIEMSWNAELSETYNFKTLFTLSDNVLPGDMTKYLSLPWQSDFYLCRSYWWPSARPDTIVTVEEYEKVKAEYPPKKVAQNLTNRVPWERGLFLNHTDTYPDQPYFANTDFTEHWSRMGFVTKKPSVGPTPIYVEVDRGVIPRQRSPPKEYPSHGGITLPAPNGGIKTLENLKNHLQTAMAVELCTIPLYLYGMYSVRTPQAYIHDPIYRDPVSGIVHGVVVEEMLHLSLAGNILRAVGGHPELYHSDMIPSYPMYMPGRIPPLRLRLRELTKPNLQTFLDVEKPETSYAPPEPDKYHTLGQFYKAIKDGLEYLSKQIPDLFDPNTAPYQFAPGLGYQPKVRDSGSSIIVTDLKTAKTAIDIIVDQGEGLHGPFDDRDLLERAHYFKFLDLQTGGQTWDVYPVVTDPTTDGYRKQDKRIYHVSLVFDAAYCFLLLTIEKLWTISSDDDRQKLVLGNVYLIMLGVLKPLAKFLVQQPIGKEGKVAGPCFGHYPFQPKESALKQLQDEIKDAIGAYLHVTAETPDQADVVDYGLQIEQLLPIQNTIHSLLDLHTFKHIASPIVKDVPPGAFATGTKGFARGF